MRTKGVMGVNADDSRRLEEQQLIERLRKIEALFARPGTEGERAAAGSAAERVRARLDGFKAKERLRVSQFSIHDPWARMLFLALVRRSGLHPYREKGQRRTTVLVRADQGFIETTLWPEFLELERTLQGYLHEITQRVISQAIHSDVGDAEEQSTPAAGASPRGMLDSDRTTGGPA